MAYECISRKKLVKLPRKPTKNCTFAAGVIISYAWKLKRVSSFTCNTNVDQISKDYASPQCKCRRENNPVILAFGSYWRRLQSVYDHWYQRTHLLLRVWIYITAKFLWKYIERITASDGKICKQMSTVHRGNQATKNISGRGDTSILSTLL